MAWKDSRDARSEGHLRALGRVCTSFANLESELGLLVITLLEVQPQAGWVIVSQLAFHQRADTVRSLLRLKVRTARTTAAFDRLLDRTERVQEQRNRLIHSAWVRRGRDVRCLTPIPGRGSLAWRADRVSAGDLDRLAGEIERVRSGLRKLSAALPGDALRFESERWIIGATQPIRGRGKP